MRFVILICLAFLLLPTGANAQSSGHTIATRGCVELGGTVALSGVGLGPRQTGEIVLQSRSGRFEMRISRWSDRRIRAQVPRRLARGVSKYDVLWLRSGRLVARFGSLTLCNSGSKKTPPARRANSEEVAAPNGSPEYVVSVAPGRANAVSNALQSRGAELLRRRSLNALNRTLLVFALPGNLSQAQAQSIVQGAANGARIEPHNIYGFAAGPRVYAASAIGDDPGTSCKLRRSVGVGVIDGPVNPGHGALRGVAITRTNVVGPGERVPPADHGTAVVSLIAGNGTNEITGFAQGARIFAASAFTIHRGRPGATLEHIALALDWLAGKRVQIVNMSFDGRANGVLRDVLAAGARKGMVMIAAVGNDGKAVARYPAAAPEVIAVTAVDARGKAYRKANRGGHVEFAAPGVEVYTAKGGRGGYQSGTSFAAPIVTALIAREASKRRISAKSMRGSLAKRARDLGTAGRDAKFGWGLVQSGGC